MTLKAGIILRQSKTRAGSESLDLQEEVCRQRAGELGADVIIVVRDPSVSAFKVHPMQRPKLKALFDHGADLDLVIYYKQNRCFRRVIPDFSDVVEWSRRHDVRLVSATQQLGDPRNHDELLLPLLTSWQDQGESETRSQIMTDHYARERRMGRWTGANPPYGYRSVLTGPKQHGLVIDEVAAEIAREAVRRALSGESLNSIVADFNRRGILCPTNRRRELLGKPLARRKDGRLMPWNRWSLTQILRSPALLGYELHEKQIVLGDDGLPVRLAPGLITEDEFDQLQIRLGDRKRKPRTQTDSLLLRVAFCPDGMTLHRWSSRDRHKVKRYFKYKCLKHFHPEEYPEGCNSQPLEATWLEALVSDLFLAAVGHVEITRRVYHKAPNASRLAMVRRALKAARAEYDGGGYSYPGGEDEYKQRTAKLSAEMRELDSQPAAGYHDEVTGELFADAWAKRDVRGRRQLMLQAGFRVNISKTAEGTMLTYALDPDLARRAGLVASGQPVALPPDSHAPWREDAASIMRAVSRRPGTKGATRTPSRPTRVLKRAR